MRALRATADRLAAPDARYEWGHMGGCNCGHLAQTVTTLSRAEIQVADAFADGQAYVALSRVTSLAGLWTAGGAITQQSVKANHKVLEFYRRQGA